MRLSKTALLAASLLTSGLLFAADQIITLGGSGNFTVTTTADNAIYTSNTSGSINIVSGAGNLIKNGGGILQYKGFQLPPFDFYAMSSTAYLAEGNLAIGIPNALNGPNSGSEGAISGRVVVNSGELQVAGYLNIWQQAGSVTNYTSGVQGVSAVILNDTATLNFINTPLNVAAGVNNRFPDGATSVALNRNMTSVLRYNMVNNLQVGGIAGGAQTVLNTGADSTYRIIINVDNLNGSAYEQVTSTYDNVNSSGSSLVHQNATTSFSGIGILAGQGDVIKTGADDFRVMGASERGLGRVVIADGSMTLAGTSGNSISTANSVNLVGNDLSNGMIGAAVQPMYQQNPGSSPPNDVWRPGYVPLTTGTGKLILANNQTIHNLQADFAFTATPDSVTISNPDGTTTTRPPTVNDAMVMAQRNQFSGEPYIPGSGRGTVINIGANTLTILQDRDGLYRGSVVGTGVFDINIAANHTFALVLDSVMDADVVINSNPLYNGSAYRGGTFIANANGLGTHSVNFGSSALTIYQDNAGTLLADLQGSGAVNLTASAFVNNSLTGTNAANNLQINVNDQRGTLAVGRVQSNFTGTLNVLDGQTLQLGTGTDNSLDNSLAAAASVTLQGGDPTAGGRVATLFVASGVQTLKNLQGNANSQVNLGRGSLVLKSGSLAGATAGVGNLIVDAGSGVFGLNGATSTYLGATVVKSGTLAVSGGLSSTSGLILSSGATFNGTSADQTMGALFGRAGSVVNMGSRNLTIGISSIRSPLLQTQSNGVNTLSSDYLSTRFTGVIPGGVNLLVDTGTPAAAGQVDVSIAGAAPTHVPAGYVAPGGRDPFDYTASGLAAATSRYLFNTAYDGAALEAAATAAEAAALAAPGDTTKAALAVQARAASDAAYLAAASLAFSGNISGTGALIIAGPDRTILGGVNSYTGATLVQGGELQVNWNSINASSGVSISSGATLSLNADASSGDGDFTRTLSGAGTFVKMGSGTAGLTASLSGFTGNIRVDAGTLRTDELGAYAGGMQVAQGATLIFNQNTNVTDPGAVSNFGSVIKNGTGTLTLTAYSEAGAAPTVTVNAGVLALTLLPSALTINTGATLQATITGGQSTANVIAGSGTLRLVGVGSTPTLTMQASNLFPSIGLELRGVTLALNGTTQTLAGFSGDANAAISLDNGTLILNTPAGVATSFNGRLLGNGNLKKAGAGSASFVSTVNTNWTGTTTVDQGMLEATPQSLGASNVIINAAGVLAVRNDDTTTAINFTNSVTGAGVLAKTGAGEVIVGAVQVTGGVHVIGGRLTSGDGSSDAVFRSVAIDSGATFQVNMSTDRLHDSGSLNHVTGAGNLAVSGPHTLTLAGTQSYTGNTELLAGAKLAFAAGVNTLNGLAGAAGTQVLMPGDLTIVQTANGTFSGTFAGTPGALTVSGTGTLAVTGDLSAQAGLVSVTVSGGRLQVDNVNTKDVTVVSGGTLAISDIAGTHASHDEYAGVVTGDGNVDIVGGGYLFINDTGGVRHLRNTGTTTVSSGTLGGNFSTSGNLVVAGGTLAPGNSPGTVTVNGNFTLGTNTTVGTYAAEVNATTSDKIVVTGSATIVNGKLTVTQDATQGSAKPAGGQQFTILTAAGGVSGNFSNASSTGIIQLDQNDPAQAATGYKRVHIDNTGSSLVMTGVAGMRDVSGFQQHDGTGGFVGLLDAGLAPAAVQSLTDNAWGAGTTALVNNFSPLGLGAEYAMAQDGENRRQAQLHDRMEQRRYDRGSPLTAEDAPWEAFLAGQSSFVNSKSSADTATFDYKTYGGLAGLDRKLNDGTVVGAALGYDNGTATIHDSGGKIEMDRFAATAFFSGQLTSRWYLDLGLTGGVGLYDVKRSNALGRLKADNTGYSGGAYAETGTLVVLAKDLHLTPYVGASYTHHEFDGFTESGNAGALKVSGWSQDSLRAQIGTGLNYFVPFEDWKIRVGLDVNYSQELLDTDSDINSRFVAGGPKFGTTANALPDGAIGVTPSLGIQITEYVSASVGYTYEVGLDSRSYQSLNFAVRTRF